MAMDGKMEMEICWDWNSRGSLEQDESASTNICTYICKRIRK